MEEKDLSQLSDIQSESGIIGTLAYHPEYCLLTEYLKPNDFYGVENACIYWSIQELYKDGITNIDAYNISNKLQSNKAVKNTIEKYNLPSVEEYMDLYKDVARHSEEEYKMLAENVVTLSFKRDLYKTLSKIKDDCFNSDKGLSELNNVVYDELDQLTQKHMKDEEIDILGAQIDSIWEEITERRTDNGLCGLPSKFKSFWNYFSYEVGELVIVMGKRKQGKSTVLLNETVHMIKNNVPTLVIDTEMSTRQYVERLIANLTGIETTRIKRGNYSKEEGNKIKKCMEWLKKQPFVHIYDPDLTDSKLYTICKMLKRKIGLQFVVYDYLKSNEKKTNDNYNVLGAKCDFLKNHIAGKLDLAVLSACQLNRSGEVADSVKIENSLSVKIEWQQKDKETILKDGVDCGNAKAKITLNRIGEAMDDDPEEYIDFVFDGSKSAIGEAKQHEKKEVF